MFRAKDTLLQAVPERQAWIFGGFRRVWERRRGRMKPNRTGLSLYKDSTVLLWPNLEKHPFPKEKWAKRGHSLVPGIAKGTHY